MWLRSDVASCVCVYSFNFIVDDFDCLIVPLSFHFDSFNFFFLQRIRHKRAYQFQLPLIVSTLRTYRISFVIFFHQHIMWYGVRQFNFMDFLSHAFNTLMQICMCTDVRAQRTHNIHIGSSLAMEINELYKRINRLERNWFLILRAPKISIIWSFL